MSSPLVRLIPKTFLPRYSTLIQRSVATSKPIVIPTAGLKPKERFLSKLFNIFRVYEDVIGITEVKAVQNKVIEAEQRFMTTQEQRRERQQQIQQIHNRLKEIHAELDKTSRVEDKYLSLITQEHSLIKEEQKLNQEFETLQKAEREYFSALSLALRESHEKERAQGERTKYWSIIGSIIGAMIGIIGATVNNQIRMKQLRKLVDDAATSSNVNELVTDLSTSFQEHQRQVSGFLSDIRSVLGSEGQDRQQAAVKTLETSAPLQQLESDLKEVVGLVKNQDKVIAQEMKEIKALFLAQHALSEQEGHSPTAVYIGDDVGELIKDSQRNLEWKMKINSLATVTLFYGVFALTLPFLIDLFKK